MEKASEKKLVKPKEVNQKVRYKCETYRKVIDLLIANQDKPDFVTKCEHIIALFEKKHGIIDLLIENQDKPDFVDKCERIIALLEKKNEGEGK